MSGVVAAADAAAPAAAEDGPKSFARRDHLASMEATAQAKWREEKLFEVCFMQMEHWYILDICYSEALAVDGHIAPLLQSCSLQRSLQ
jgi:hypothetical protein